MKLPQYTVQGVIMIDSVFPTSKVTDRYPRTIAEVAASFQLPARMSEARRVQAQQCILYAHEMQRDWRPPLFPLGLPPTVLIRAADPVHLDPDAKPHYLDLIRNWTYLGWEEYDRSFIQSCNNLADNAAVSPNDDQDPRSLRDIGSTATAKSRMIDSTSI
ncbi:hypothetical protein AnigIFM49718_011171 [Aspergillus niger]|nr:hypothetical protein AnigIFM49718_011171 [Aspergillus niger]